MKVKYTIKIEGSAQIRGRERIEFPGWVFEFIAQGDSNLLRSLEVTILDVPKENWPTIFEVSEKFKDGVPVFPFGQNPLRHQFQEISRELINLESILALFGVQSFKFSERKEEWLPDPDDELVSLWSGMHFQPKEYQASDNFLEYETLSRSIVAANASSFDLASLGHFRIAQGFYREERYIEAVRHFFFALEFQYGGGKFRTADLINSFCNSAEFRSGVLVCINEDADFERKFSHLLNENADEIVRSCAKYFVRLRGEVQHSNKRTFRMCHPSNELYLRVDAHCLYALCANIFWARAVEILQDL